MENQIFTNTIWKSRNFSFNLQFNIKYIMHFSCFKQINETKIKQNHCGYINKIYTKHVFVLKEQAPQSASMCKNFVYYNVHLYMFKA